MFCSHLTTLRWADLSVNNMWKTKLIIKCTKHLYWEQTGRLNIEFSRSLSFSFCHPSASSLSYQNLFVLKGSWFGYTSGRRRRKRKGIHWCINNVVINFSALQRNTILSAIQSLFYTGLLLTSAQSSSLSRELRTCKYATPVFHIKYKPTQNGGKIN